MSSTSKKIGLKLRELRDSKNITREQVSKLLFASTSTIIRQESGNSSLTIDDLERYCTIYDVSIVDLLKDEK